MTALLVGLLLGVQDAPAKTTPQLLRELNHDDPAVRKAAFQTLRDAGNSSLKRTLTSLANRWLKTAVKERQRAVRALRKEARKGFNPAAFEEKRREVLDLLAKGNTAAMKPKVQAMWKEFYFDPADAAKDPDLAAATARVKELASWLAPLDDAADVAGKLSAAFQAADGAEVMLLAPRRDQATLRQNAPILAKLPAEEARFLTMLNRYRMLVGKAALRIDPRLCDAAREHSKDMHDHDFFSHTSPLPGKRTFGDRAARHKTGASAENIYTGSPEADGPFWGWFGSLGHHRNNLRDGSTFGVGNHGKLWTLMLG